MPAQEPIPEPLPSPELVLIAIDRAYRHRRNPKNPGASMADIKAHLGLPHTGATTLRLRQVWQVLEADGLIEQTRRRSSVFWQLTRNGHRRLATALDASELYPLPESPQHRKWRETHAAAGERIEGFHTDLADLLDEAATLLDVSRQPASSEWYALGRRLEGACGRLGSATYCLYEWAEPDDSHADIDEPPFGQGGRRDTSQWDKR